MPSMIPVEPFAGKFILHDDDNVRTWQPCKVVGVNNNGWLIALVHSEDGIAYATELDLVFEPDAEMPPAN